MKMIYKGEIFAIAAAIIAIAMTSADGASNSDSPSSPGWFKQNFGSLSWDEVGSVVESPKDISFRVKTHVRYKKDESCAGATGKDTWTRGYGDCKDFAACVSDLCKQKGFDVSIYVFHKTTGKDRFQGHAVAVGTWNNQTWMSSNGQWYSAKSFTETKKMVTEGLGWKAEETIVTPIRNVTTLLIPIPQKRKC
jgi:hypothetical protein